MQTGQIVKTEITELKNVDKKLIQCLVENARTPLSELAKKVRLSKPSVLYRLAKLRERGILLDAITYINPIRLGLCFYVLRVFVSPLNEAKFQEKVREIGSVTFFAKINYRYNYLVWVCVPSHRDFIENLQKILNVAGDQARYEYQRVIDYKFWPYNLFNEQVDIFKIPKFIPYKQHKIDKFLLKDLCVDATISNIELAKKYSVSKDTIKNRRKHLEEAGIILGYFQNYNIYNLGFAVYSIKISLKDYSNLDAVLDYLNNLPNTNTVLLCETRPELDVIFVLQNFSFFHDTFERIIKNFSNTIDEYEILFVAAQFKEEHMPDLSVLEPKIKEIKKDN